MAEYTITIPGQPVAKGRHRMTRAKLAYGNDGKPYVIQPRPFTPEKTRAWEKTAKQWIKSAIRAGEPLCGPISMTAIATFTVPVSWPQWKRTAALSGIIRPTSKPDLDNVIKALKDAINELGWNDDCQVVESSEVKRYGEKPGIFAKISEIDGALPSQITSKDEFEAFQQLRGQS